MGGHDGANDLVLPRALARIALLAFWALVGWGWLLLVLALVDAMREGVGPALARLLPLRDRSPWAWLNAVSAALALAVGLVVGGVALLARGQGPPSSAGREDGPRSAPSDS